MARLRGDHDRLAGLKLDLSRDLAIRHRQPGEGQQGSDEKYPTGHHHDPIVQEARRRTRAFILRNGANHFFTLSLLDL
jgi:hypothetical protein